MDHLWNPGEFQMREKGVDMQFVALNSKPKYRYLQMNTKGLSLIKKTIFSFQLICIC